MTKKIALITGGSRGLGSSMAIELSKKGHDVIITYNTKLEEAKAVILEVERNGQKAIALQLNVGDSKTFPAFHTEVRDHLKEKWNRETFDFLVNNAGIGIHASFAETSEEQFDQLMNIHFKGTYFLTQNLLTLINDGGRIVNISSGLARFALPGYSAYAAMKGAIEVLTRYMAKELGSRGISVNTIAPGAVETDFSGGAVRDNKDLNKQISSLVALGRVGLADDIGGAVASLLSEESHWINAQRIEVSGGMLI